MIQALKRLWDGFLPPEKPTRDLGPLLRYGHEAGVNLESESFLVGIRGYYNPGQNQRKIYDDAMFLVTPSRVYSFNANLDPGAFRQGIANLVKGTWKYKIGIHGLNKPPSKQYRALVQAGPVKVLRDDRGFDYGWFGINIHRGGYSTVSSEGCQTIPPGQYDDFLAKVENTMRARKQETITYILKEMIHEDY